MYTRSADACILIQLVSGHLSNRVLQLVPAIYDHMPQVSISNKIVFCVVSLSIRKLHINIEPDGHYSSVVSWNLNLKKAIKHIVFRGMTNGPLRYSHELSTYLIYQLQKLCITLNVTDISVQEGISLTLTALRPLGMLFWPLWKESPSRNTNLSRTIRSVLWLPQCMLPLTARRLRSIHNSYIPTPDRCWYRHYQTH